MLREGGFGEGGFGGVVNTCSCVIAGTRMLERWGEENVPTFEDVAGFVVSVKLMRAVGGRVGSTSSLPVMTESSESLARSTGRFGLGVEMEESVSIESSSRYGCPRRVKILLPSPVR